VTDEEIIKLVVAGEIDKYGEIIERYQKRLAGFINKMIGRQPEVDDLVEETLIAVYQNLAGFEGDKKFSSWILRIAHNKTVDFIKKKKPIYMGEDWEEIVTFDKLLEDTEIENENKKMVAEALEELEVKYREVLVLFYFEDKSYEEISDILHITKSNVGVIISRAKKQFREKFQPKADPPQAEKKF